MNYDNYGEQTLDLGAGYTAEVQFRYDTDHGAPWEDDDGRGIVSEWTTRDKLPGERVLCTDSHGRDKRFYDWAGTIAKAKADGWDAPPYKTGTKGETAARAVAADFEYLRSWCADEWCFVGVLVSLRYNGAEVDSDACWGYETYDNYHETAARETAEGMRDSHIKERARESRRKAKETRERHYWEARGVCTI
jgi:hypothetical protein